MTNEPAGSNGALGVCPDPEMLSAYLDGKLNEARRGLIEDHISRCEDCYFVVRESALVLKETTGSGMGEGDGIAPDRPMDRGAKAPPGGPPPSRPPGFPMSRSILQLAATLIVAGGAVVFWHKTHPTDPYAALVRPLVEAVGERRFVEPRLTGGFRFGPMIGSKRGASPSDSERWSVFASAAEIKQRVDKAPTPVNRRALAAAQLLMDETDAAVQLMEQLARELPQDGGVRSDLSAAYISRARRTGREDDWPRALEAAEAALLIDPGLIEPLFNRACALEAMSLWAEAESAWRNYLESTSAAPDGWTDEARRRLEALRKRPASDLEERKKEISAALLSDDQGGLDQAAAAAPAAGMEVFDALLIDEALADDDWARRVSALRHALRLSPARVGFPDEPVRPTDRAEFRSYGQARAHYKKLEWAAARTQLSGFKSRRGTFLDPLPVWASAYVAAIDYQAGRNVEADDALQALESESLAGPLFLGRVAWVRGMIALRSGRYDVAAHDYSAASALFAEANDPGDGSVMAVAAGELLDRLGLASQSWEQILLGLRSRGSGQRLRSSALLLRTAEIAWSGGSTRAALAFAREAESLVWNGDPLGDRVVVERTLARILLREDPDESLRRLAAARSLAEAEPDHLLRSQLTRELDRLDAERQFAQGAPGFEGTVTRVLDDLSAQGARGLQADLLALRGAWRLRLGAAVSGEADLTEALKIFETNAAPSDVSRAAYHHAAWKAFEELIDVRAAEGRPLEALALVERSLRFLRGSEDRSEFGPKTLQRIIDQAPSRRATLVLVPTQRGLHAWVLTRGHLEYSYRALTSSALEHDVSTFLQALERGGGTTVSKALGDRLFEQLLRPSLAALGDAETVDVVPHRFLSQVPFHALWDSKKNRYWGQTVSTLMGSSLRPPARSTLVSWRGISILAVDEGKGVAALPGARTEGTAIASLYPAPRLLLGNRATSTSLVQALQTSSIVHFAGHAQSSDAYPDLASLLVSDGHGGSRPFLARSLLGLRLSGLSLVVLASCSSIQSPQSLDHGMMTVAGHFLNAGARSVLGALWDVDDEDARAFMVRFHTSLARSLDPVAALSAARSGSIEAGEDPKRWAPFALAME